MPCRVKQLRKQRNSWHQHFVLLIVCLNLASTMLKLKSLPFHLLKCCTSNLIWKGKSVWSMCLSVRFYPYSKVTYIGNTFYIHIYQFDEAHSLICCYLQEQICHFSCCVVQADQEREILRGVAICPSSLPFSQRPF